MHIWRVEGEQLHEVSGAGKAGVGARIDYTELL